MIRIEVAVIDNGPKKALTTIPMKYLYSSYKIILKGSLDMNTEIKQKIMNELQKIEETENVKIILAVESGSRA